MTSLSGFQCYEWCIDWEVANEFREMKLQKGLALQQERRRSLGIVTYGSFGVLDREQKGWNWEAHAQAGVFIFIFIDRFFLFNYFSLIFFSWD